MNERVASDSANQPRGDGWSSRWFPYALVACFLTALLPLASDFTLHGPDERHYSDAALWMLESGDFATPCNPDGTPRYRKPILNYWLVAASFRLCGISPLSSRLPSLLAAAGTIWLAYAIAHRWWRCRTTAALAGCALATQPIFIHNALLATPDVPLCFFLTLSVGGFLGLLLAEQPTTKDGYAAYLGAALAFATKGLPALLLVAFCIAYALAHPLLRTRWRRLFAQLPIFIAAILLAICFGLLTYGGADRAWSVFYGDQIGERFHLHAMPAWPRRMIECAAILVLLAGPCGLGIFAAAWNRMRNPKLVPPALTDEPSTDGARLSSARDLESFGYAWMLCTAIFATGVATPSLRYLLPAMGLYSVACVLTFQRWCSATPPHWLSLGLRGWIVATVCGQTLLVAGASALLIEHADVVRDALLAGAVIGSLGLSAVAWRWASSPHGPARCLVAWHAALLLTVPLVWLVMQPLASPDSGSLLVAELDRQPVVRTRTALVGKPALASKVRVETQGRIWFDYAGERATGRLFDTYDRVVLTVDIDAYRIPLDFETQRICCGYRDLSFASLCLASARGELSTYLAEHRQWFVIATRSTAERQRLAMSLERARSDPGWERDQGDHAVHARKLKR